MKVVYFQPFNNEEEFSQEALVEKHIPIGVLYLSDDPKEDWGDDWDDFPAAHNAGPPYGDHIKEVFLHYGEEIHL